MNKIIKYSISSPELDIVPSIKKRNWMNDTPDSFAYRCLPLTVANGLGWQFLNPCKFVASWKGENSLKGVKVKFYPKTNQEKIYSNAKYVLSHFGNGILTFTLDCLFRTESGHNLYIKGPTNHPKAKIFPLEGVVETDWLPFTFTMNWKFIEEGEVTFERDEPFCQLFPFPRHYMENWQTQEIPISSVPEEYNNFKDWKDSRSNYISTLSTNGAKGERDYIKGIYKSGEKFKDHQTNIQSCPFLKSLKQREERENNCTDQCCREEYK
jgi:hypothetical protein